MYSSRFLDDILEIGHSILSLPGTGGHGKVEEEEQLV